ncbi:MAG: hypothetical protein L0271_20540 [Gemmatimonadetes bacterium]|nr:hypothetical protein [Gemmatimonadota bacterium]
MFELIGLVVAAGAAIGGYIKAKSFVSKRLRYVDAAKSGMAPVLAGAAAAIVAAPIVAVLPIVGAPAAIALGVGVGAGTRAGVKEINSGAWND